MMSLELISGVASQEKRKETKLCHQQSIRPYTLASGVMSQAEKNCQASSECPA